MTKILHIADIHIGKNRNFPNPLERYQILIEEILHKIKEHSIDLMIISGDLLEHPTPSLAEKNLASTLLGECPVPLALIPGNHERIGKEWNDTTIHWIWELTKKSNHIKMWIKPTIEIWNDICWLALPFTGWNQPSFYLVVNWLLEKKIAKNWKGPIIGLSHEFFHGSLKDNGTLEMGNKKIKLPLIDQIDYWALGDIHVRQKLGPNAYYCGSPLQQNFGESGKKGGYIYDTISKKVENINFSKPKRLETFTTIPKEWPSNVFVKLLCSHEEIPHPLPSFIVSLEIQNSKKENSEDKDNESLATSMDLENIIKEGMIKKGIEKNKLEKNLKLFRTLSMQMDAVQVSTHD